MILALEESVKVKIMVKVIGEYEVASGKNMDDLIEFNLYQMDKGNISMVPQKKKMMSKKKMKMKMDQKNPQMIWIP